MVPWLHRGHRAVAAGHVAPLSLPLRTVALPFMDDLHTALRQHVQLALLEGTGATSPAGRHENDQQGGPASLSAAWNGRATVIAWWSPGCSGSHSGW